MDDRLTFVIDMSRNKDEEIVTLKDETTDLKKRLVISGVIQGLLSYMLDARNRYIRQLEIICSENNIDLDAYLNNDDFS